MKIILGIFGVIAFGIGVLVISFMVSMKPDPDLEEKITEQAEKYLEANFNDNFKIYDTLYDNMGNFEFDYAAMVRDAQSQTEFLVYQNPETKQLVDTFVSDKWSDDMETEFRPYVTQAFGDSAILRVFVEEKIGQKLNVEPLHPGSYKKYDVAPTVRLDIPRESEAGDEQLFTDFISYLTEENKLQHGQLLVTYVAETGELLEDEEWSREF